MRSPASSGREAGNVSGTDRLHDRLCDKPVCQTLAQKPLATGPGAAAVDAGYQYGFEPDPPLSRPIDWGSS